MESRSIAAQLLENGDSLWSSVECDVKQDRVIVYARLHTNSPLGVEGALVASERVLMSVLDGHDWLAAVQWSDRLCRTFTAQRAEPAKSEPDLSSKIDDVIRNLEHVELALDQDRATLADQPEDAQIVVDALEIAGRVLDVSRTFASGREDFDTGHEG